MNTGRPGLPAEAAVWAEAQAALLDLLRRRDAEHALKRVARACLHLTGGAACAIEAAKAAEAADAVTGGTFAAALPSHQPGDVFSVTLTHLGSTVGTLRAEVPSGSDLHSLAERLQPLLDAAAEILAHWLAEHGQASTDSLSLVRAAMREGGTFVWEWDVATDALGDIDEGARMLGYPPNAIGHTQADWDRLIHPEDAAAVEAAYQAHARGETDSYHALYRGKAADGTWRWIEERGRIVERDGEGRPTRMFGTQTDATIRHELDQARRQQLAAEAANAAKTQFLSRVSHELRTPLNAVLGFAQLLEIDEAERLGPGQRRRVQLIRQAGDYLLAMISDLLDLSLVESGRLPMQFEAVPLGALVHDSIDLLRGQAAAATVALVQGVIRPGVMVRGDAMRLKQVLINLITNGIKYNRPGGFVELVVQADDERCTVDIRDSGIGLPPDQLDKLFLPFQRLGRENSAVEGSGLGLALSQALVQAMGGSLTAHPLPQADGPGTIFRLVLPIAG